MTDLFDQSAGKNAGDKGMQLARTAPRIKAWSADAGSWFIRLPVGETFTSDDLIKRVGLPDEGVNKNNAVGAWFNGLANSRFIVWTGATVKSERVDRHGGMIRVWQKIKG